MQFLHLYQLYIYREINKKIKTAPADINIEDLLDDSDSDDKKIIPTLEETPNQIEKDISSSVLSVPSYYLEYLT